MGVMLINVSFWVLESMLQGDLREAASDVPGDARVISVHTDPERQLARLVVDSSEWPEIRNGNSVPTFEPVFTEEPL